MYHEQFDLSHGARAKSAGRKTEQHVSEHYSILIHGQGHPGADTARQVSTRAHGKSLCRPGHGQGIHSVHGHC